MKQDKTSFFSHPLLWLTLCTFTATFTIFFFADISLWLCGALLLFVILCLLLRKHFTQWAQVLVFLVLLLVCSVRATIVFCYQENQYLQYNGQDAIAQIQIVDKTAKEHRYIEYRAKVLALDGKKTHSFYAIVYTDSSIDYNEGDIVQGSFFCELPEEYSYGFPNRLHKRSDGILMQLTAVESPAYLSHTNSNPISDAVLSLRKAIFSKLSLMPKDTNALSQALLLGDKTNLSPQITRNFSQIGASHILAVSGMHLSIFCAFFFLLIGKSRFAQPIRITIFSIFILFCALLTGSAPSVLRAAGMLLCATWLQLTRRRFEPLEVLCLACFVLVIIDPHILLNIGFLLSFFATLGIVFSVDKHKKNASLAKRVPNHLLLSLQSSLAAILFTLPICAVFFGKISVLAPISTLLLGTLCISAILFSILWLILPGAIASTSIALTLFTLPQKWMMQIAQRLSKVENISLYFTTALDDVFIMIFVFLLLLVLVFGLSNRRLSLAILLCSLLIYQPISYYNRPNKQDDFSFTVTASQNQEVILVSDKESSVLIDCALTDYDLCKRNLEILRNTYRKDTLDAFVCTQYSLSQVKNITYFLSHYYIRSLYVPEPKTPNESVWALQLESICAYYDVSFFYSRQKQTIGAFELLLERDHTFAVYGYETSLCYFNQYWNQSTYQTERYLRLYRETNGYFLFSADVLSRPTKSLSESDQVQYLNGDKTAKQIHIQSLQRPTHKIFLFVT